MLKHMFNLIVRLSPWRTKAPTATRVSDVYSNPTGFAKFAPVLRSAQSCPCCGGSPHILEAVGRVAIACSSCGIMTPMVAYEDWPRCLTTWNKRTV